MTTTIIASLAKTARAYVAREEGGANVTIIAASDDQALRAAIKWCEGGEYDLDETTDTVTQHVWVRRAGAADDCRESAIEFRVR